MPIWRQVTITICIAGVLAFGLGAGCSDHAASSPVLPTAISFDATRAWGDLQHQLDFGYRIPGTDAHRATRDWLVSELSKSSTKVTLQPFTQHLGGKDITMWNIIAVIPGTGTTPRDSVLLCAHWDSRPTADMDPVEANRKKPIAGANDGASGVAVLLEIARQVKAQPIARDVVITLFDGEDYGPGIDNMLLGSKYFAKHLPEPQPSWGILLDMIGDADLAIYREPSSEYYAKRVNDRIFRAARDQGYLRSAGKSGFVDARGKFSIIDDHTPLNEAGIPVADLIDFDYPSWHTLGDTADKCDANSLKVVGKVVLAAISLY